MNAEVTQTNNSNNSGSNYSNNNSDNRPLIQSEGGLSLVDILENVFFFRWFFFATFALITAIAIVYALLAAPVYRTDALIQVEEKKGSNLGALSQITKALDIQQSPVLGEIEILRSRTVIGEAIEATNANVLIGIDNRLPLIGGWLSRILDKDADGLTKPLWGEGQSSSIAWGGEVIKLVEILIPQKLYGQMLLLKVGQNQSWILEDNFGKVLLKGQGTKAFHSDDQQLSLTLESLKARAGTVFKIKVTSLQSSIINILNRMTVAETKRQSGIIKLTLEGTNSGATKEMLSAIVNSYVTRNISRRSEESEKSLIFLNSELPRLKKNLEAAEQDLNTYRKNFKTVDIPSEVKELLTQSTAQEKARLDLELKKKELESRYQHDHPLLKGLNLQLAQLVNQSAQMNQELSKLPQVQQEYLRKERDVQVNSQLYVSLLNNAQQLQIAKAGTVGNVFVVDPPVNPEKAVRPNKPLIVVIGALLGIILGFLVCQLIATLSGLIRDPKKLEQTVSLPILAILPIAPDQIEHIERTEDKGVFMLSQEKSTSTPVESLRSLRTSVLFNLSEKTRSKVILITSAVPGQGKSFISSNLAFLLASTEKRTLLIEADVRKATMRRYVKFDPIKDLGLTNFLQNLVPLEGVIKHDVYPYLDFVPAGKRIKNPGDILSSDRMLTMINQLAEKYDYVVIDSPPLLPVNDARALAKASDMILFVVRQEMCSTNEVLEALNLLDKGGSKVDGLVFNGFIPSQIKYGYNYGYGYGTYKLLGRYGKYGYGKYGYGKEYRYGSYGKSNDDSNQN
ncbi:polysaccharide biosynthesis tyrosine autokinase [Polynucleobacter kasalickyi]|uniref:non-specific protein-tyrosine kinase n=1 Tax=Polynucleobacter kasalickyi TaxID=1938817 RepID=A0A1W2CBA3_9BURK|nr:polysaccharide biosynthesis tyrosine autokinase [Polynucleobacter kasalickyi]SMC82264.1 tyrosine-protein kinase Etk/Wzc [Polynucleobacter kasalickyi]